MRAAEMTCVVGVILGLAAAPVHAQPAGPAADQTRAPSAPVAAAPRALRPELTRALEQAERLRLSSSTGWRRLVLFDGGRSQADDARFFLAPGGPRDPDAELRATLFAIFAPVLPGREETHVRCRFPARVAFLERALSLDAENLPAGCTALAEHVATYSATRVSLVYASNYLDDPSSAFGHTFLRLHRGPASTDATDDAEDRGVDYTATTDTRNPLLYALKGLSGMFRGRFRFSTYETMLREYTIASARDVWEYELTLQPEQVQLLVLHLWELSNASIDYLYISENCSYRIVAALDAAAPALELAKEVGGAAFPVDTVRAVMATPGLVRSILYRPSVRSTLRGALAPLEGDERLHVDRLLDDPDAVLPEDMPVEERARVLDAAVRVVDARHARAILDGEAEGALLRRRTLAARRDRLVARTTRSMASGGVVAPPATPVDEAPHKSHAPMRLMVGGGSTTQYGSAFATLGARLALHDFADPPDGVPDLVQLQFLDTRLRFDWARRALTLDSLTFAELMAINPLTRFEQPISWRFRGFGVRLHDEGCRDCFAHGAEGAIGLALATTDERVAFFMMADTFVAFSSRLDGIDGSVVRVGVGPLSGVRLRLPASTVGLVTGTVSYLPGQAPQTTFDVRASLRTLLDRNVAFGLEAAAQPLSAEAQLASYVYF